MNEQSFHRIIWRLIPNYHLRGIHDAITQIRNVYSKLSPSQPLSLNFEADPILKHAYYYLYFVCHSNAVWECWTNFNEIGLFHEFTDWADTMNVCCIGGGSGCDLVGLCQYLEDSYIDLRINAIILDYYDWSYETRRLLRRIDSGNQYEIANFDFMRYDFFEFPIRRRIAREINKADLITIVKFISAVDDYGDSENQLRRLLKHMRRNARVFFMDNGGGSSGNVMKNVADDLGLSLIAEVVPHRQFWIRREESVEMDFNCFGVMPLKKTRVTTSLWMKN